MWVDWDAQPLGEVSDPELARRLGCSGPTVGNQRRKRGIPAHQTQHRWTPEQDHWLQVHWGEHDIDVLARKLPGPSHSPRAVSNRAQHLRLGSQGRGRYTLTEVAEILGLCPGQVSELAARNGIHLPRRPRHPSYRRFGDRDFKRNAKHRAHSLSERHVKRLTDALTREMAGERSDRRRRPLADFRLGRGQRAVLRWLAEHGPATQEQVRPLYDEHAYCSGWTGLRTPLTKRRREWAANRLRGLERRGLVELDGGRWALTEAGRVKVEQLRLPSIARET